MLPIKIFNSTVASAEMSLGFGQDASQVQMEIVEVLPDGDSIVSGQINHPYKIDFGSGIYFDGLLQEFERSISSRGNPVYRARLEAPTKLTQGLSLVISDYTGSVNNTPNLMNLFGYFEDKYGYGGALINDFGMVWSDDFRLVTLSSSGTIDSTSILGKYGIKHGILELQTGVNPIFGNAFGHAGHSYHFNFDNLPDPPTGWRYNGNGGATPLFAVINQLCNDVGHQFYTDLNINSGSSTGPHTIVFKSIDLTSSPSIGGVEEYINSKDSAIVKSVGYEGNFLETSLFVVGANKESLFQQLDSGKILPFYGLDNNGQPRVGNYGSEPWNSYYVNVDATEISGVINSTEYTITEAEMRCALGNQSSWLGFMKRKKAAFVASVMQSASDFNPAAGGANWLPHDFVDESVTSSQTLSNIHLTDNLWTNKINKIYQFVRKIATDYYGKKFVVILPNTIRFKIEPETANIQYDWLPTDSAYLDEGTNPLDLNIFNAPYFQNDEYKYSAFVKIGPVDNADLSLSNQVGLIQDKLDIFGNIDESNVYIPCRILNQYGILYTNLLESAVVIELSQPIYNIAPDVWGGLEEISNLLDISSNWAFMRSSSSSMRLHPAAKQPVASALPFVSTTESYGPWSIAGPSGWTDYRKEDALAPWNYGGYYYMEQAAQSYLQDFVKNAQILDVGTIQIPGMPDRRLGDPIVSSGVNITNISIGIGGDGITTTYNLRTKTEKQGALGKWRRILVERMGRTYQQLGRNLLNNARQNIPGSSSFSSIDRRWSFMDGMARPINQQSPHSVLVAMTLPINSGTDGKGNGEYFQTFVSAQTYGESIANGTHSGLYKHAAIMSYDGLLRPYTTNNQTFVPNRSDPLPLIYMGCPLPTFKSTSGYFQEETRSSSITLNPFGTSHDIHWLSTKSGEYEGGMRQYPTGSKADPSKGIGLKTPIVAVGWGKDIWGHPIPNPSGWIADPHLLKSWNENKTYRDAHRSIASGWAAGPIDLKYDTNRGVWTVPTKMKGLIQHADGIASKTTGLIKLMIKQEGNPVLQFIQGGLADPEYTLEVYNPWMSTLPYQHLATAYYDQWDERWTIDGVDCEPYDPIPA